MSLFWPDNAGPHADYLQQILAHGDFPGRDQLPPAWLAQWQTVWANIAADIAARKQLHGAFIIGIHGGQGSGKSTLSKALAAVFRHAFGWNVVVVSIDDLYLPHASRQQLAATQHRLFATRGVPGTHDAALGEQLFRQLKTLPAGSQLSFPAFDKASDDRLSGEHWHQVQGPVDLVLFEGWCVGCKAVPPEQLSTPVNELEKTEDPDGRWRHEVNRQLADDYARWFAAIDYLLMLRVPDMQAVLNWRSEQELGNQKNAVANSPDRSMDNAALQRFIQHYQRLTEQALRDMPQWADVILTLNHQHQVDAIALKPAEGGAI